MTLRLLGKQSRLFVLLVIVTLASTFFAGMSHTQAAASDAALSTFLKQMKEAETSLNQADQYFSKNKNVYNAGWSEKGEQVKDTFISLIEKGENYLTAALRSKYSYDPKYIDLFNKLKIYETHTVLHEDGSGVDFVRTFISEGYACYSPGCQGAPVSYIMQVKYMDGKVDVFTTHGEIYGSDTSEIIDLRVIDRYGFFRNKNKETLMIMQYNDWRGGGWNIEVRNLTKKRVEKVSDYIPLASLPAALSKTLKGNQKSLLNICGGGECTSKQEEQFSITDIDEVNRTITLGSTKIKLKNVSATAIKPNLTKQKLNAVIDTAKKGTFPNIKITLESSLDEVKKIYGPLNKFEGGTYYLKQFSIDVDADGRLSGLVTDPKQLGIGTLTLSQLESLLQTKAVKDTFSGHVLMVNSGYYRLIFYADSMSKPISMIMINHR